MNHQLRTISVRGPMGFDDPAQLRRYLAATCTCPKCTARRSGSEPEPEEPEEDDSLTAALEARADTAATDHRLQEREDALRAGWARLYAWALVVAICAVIVLLSARHCGLIHGN